MSRIRRQLALIPTWAFVVVALAGLVATTCSAYVEIALGLANPRIPTGRPEHDQAYSNYRGIRHVNRITLGFSVALVVTATAGSVAGRMSEAQASGAA
jgi:hypothetical protein